MLLGLLALLAIFSRTVGESLNIIKHDVVAAVQDSFNFGMMPKGMYDFHYIGFN